MSILRTLLFISLPLTLLSACGGDDTGSITVQLATQGANADPDGYVIAVGDRTTNAPANGDVTITDLAAGSYTISLSGVAPGCGVDGINPIFLALDEGGQGRAGFRVACPAPATVLFTVTTTGPADPDGYLVQVGPGEPLRILANGVTSVSSTAIGMRSLLLSDVAPDCSPSNENNDWVEVRVDQPAEVNLVVRCGAMGALHATLDGTRFTGHERLYIDGNFYGFDDNNEVNVPALRSGTYDVWVDHCTFGYGDTRPVTVAPGITTDVTLAVSFCGSGPF